MEPTVNVTPPPDEALAHQPLGAHSGVGGYGGKARSSKQSHVLTTINEAHFSWFHVKAILIAGVGFFTDAYDLFVIGLVKPMFGVVYYAQNNGKLPVHIDLWITGIALAGTLCGQIVFGVCGDYLGRKKIYLLTLFIIIVATIGQAMASSTVFGISADVELIFWRFIMGFGIGGDYPLSATIMAEYSSTKWRGAFLASVFAMQGFGILSGSIVSLIVVASFKHKIEHGSILYLDFAWRIILGLGCIPAVATIYLRSKLPETPRYTLDVVRDEEKAQRNLAKVIDGEGNWDDDYFEPATADRITWRKLSAYLTTGGIWNNRNFWVLIGTTTTWFFLDIAFYSQNLFIPNVLSAIGYAPKIDLPAAGYFVQGISSVQPYSPTLFAPANSNFDLGRVYAYNTPQCVGTCAQAVYNKIYKLCAGNAAVAMMGTVPGYWFTIAFIEILGRVFINWMGFSMMTILLIILASAYTHILAVSKWLFIVLYALTFFFANFGPNTITFVQPVELFETRYRSTLHGISAASGKAGALIGALVIGYLFTSTKVALTTALAVLASTNFVGLLCCMFCPEAKQLPLELSCHTESWFGRVIGRRRGYTLQMYRDGVTLEEYLAAKTA